MAETSRATEHSEQRPTLVLIVYCWDMLLGILAIFGALAALGGQVAVGTRLVMVPLPLQILGALSAAAYAAVLIMVAALLTRPQRWIQRMQITTLVVAIALAAISLIVAGLQGGLTAAPVLVTLLVVLLDALAIVVMTERRITRWYVEAGPTPRYASGLVAFWALSSIALLVVNSVS